MAVYVSAVIVIAVLLLTGRLSVENSAVAFIVKGGWTRGLNLFAVANILFLFIEVSISVIFIRILLRAVTMNIGTKGETIGRLLLNFVSYVAVIVFVYFALSYIGIKTGTLVASLGLITFALSLGAQDLVKDILAGLAIVFDGAYQVGDIIEVNGFRGKVLEVGVRSIKIEGRGGNILIMGNRDVKNIINKTRKNSWYPLEINIKEGQDISTVEKLLRENLSKIGESIDEIISGPVYKGITGIGHGFITLSVIAECDEEDYYAVGRELNRAVIALFESHGISIT
jgi:small conductance mechanosensitive channel